MADFSNKWHGIKGEMFANAEDPLNSQWWNKAWEIMINPDFGPVVDKQMPDVEVALLLMELRNIHAGYEFMYYSHDYDPMWLDYWDATGLPWDQLVSYLTEQGLLENNDVELSRDDDTRDVTGAVHTYCWGKRQAIFDTLLLDFDDEMDLGMFMLGGKIPRNKDAAHRIIGYVHEQFDF